MIQRVVQASVNVDDQAVSAIGRGLLVLVGVGANDGEEDARYTAGKIAGLRIFDDAQGKMNLSVTDIGGSVLIVSQFTLYGDCRKGRRPSFTDAAPPQRAEALYAKLADEVRACGVPVQTGRFQAHMQVALVNDGPVTVLLDSARQW